MDMAIEAGAVKRATIGVLSACAVMVAMAMGCVKLCGVLRVHRRAAQAEAAHLFIFVEIEGAVRAYRQRHGGFPQSMPELIAFAKAEDLSAITVGAWSNLFFVAGLAPTSAEQLPLILDGPECRLNSSAILRAGGDISLYGRLPAGQRARSLSAMVDGRVPLAEEIAGGDALTLVPPLASEPVVEVYTREMNK